MCELRPVQIEDMEDIRRWRNHPDMSIWFGDTNEISVTQQALWYQDYKNRQNDLLFVVEVNGTAVGTVGLNRIDVQNGCAEFGRLMISPDFQKRGYGKLATGMMIDLATEWGLRVLHLRVKLNNIRAIHIYETFGWKLVTVRDGMAFMDLELNA